MAKHLMLQQEIKKHTRDRDKLDQKIARTQKRLNKIQDKCNHDYVWEDGGLGLADIGTCKFCGHFDCYPKY